MFYLLCLAVCLAVWFLVLAGTSLVCLWGARFLGFLTYRPAPARAANRLFVLRILPLVFACVVTFGFVLPAFVKFEPRSSGEMMSLRLLVLGALGAFALAAMGIRAARSIWATMSVQKQWRRCSKKLGCIHFKDVDVPVYCLDGPRSVMTVVGIFKPEIFVARKVAQVLSPEELSAAIAHERAHVRAFDNLKQVLLKIIRPPRWMEPHTSNPTETAWTNASEVAADEAALASGASPLDLSAALVKVARLTSQAVVGEAVAASHLLPVVSGSSMEARMSHLQELLEGKGRSGPVGMRNGKLRILFSFIFLTIAYGACVHVVLPWVHEALESLVR